MIKRLNSSCAYFPCHKGLEDCTFCYCPFYPCLDRRFGRYVAVRGARKVWSCKDCSRVHKKNFVDMIFQKICKDRPKMRKVSAGFNFEKTGVIILGHGSKLKQANDTVAKVAKDIMSQGLGLTIVEPAYLSLCQPDLQKTTKKVVEYGCKRVVIVPFFLFMGNHASRDIPKAISQEAKKYKDVRFIYAKNLGQDARIKSIVMDCLIEALR